MNVITLDFETYYDTEHSLAHLSAVQYVHSPLFKVWGVGIKMNDGPTEWFGADECADAIAWAINQPQHIEIGELSLWRPF